MIIINVVDVIWMLMIGIYNIIRLSIFRCSGLIDIHRSIQISNFFLFGFDQNSNIRKKPLNSKSYETVGEIN